MSLELEETTKTSPMMVQWNSCKQRAGSALLFFRLGDFYEAFYDDAVVISKELNLTLTKRHEIPMCGVPAHTCENYIDKLVAKGYRIAVAEQMEDPSKVKGLVKRDIVRTVSPGTLMNSSLLSDKTNNYFASVTRLGQWYGLCFTDLTTGECHLIEFEKEQELINELFRLRPAEILTSKKFHAKQPELFQELKNHFNFSLNLHDDWHFEHQSACDFLLNHLGVRSLDGFGLKGMISGINAAGALLSYLQDHLCMTISQIREITPYSTSHYMSLDRISQRNLELTESLYDRGKQNTLLSILDKTKTPMGARLLHRWVKQPLLCPLEIKKRQDAIETLLQKRSLMDRLGNLLNHVRDLERLVNRIGTGNSSPRDVVALRFSCEPIGHVKSLLQQAGLSQGLLWESCEKLDPLPELTALIARALIDEAPMRLSDGAVFRDGFHAELDELRELSRDSKAWLGRYQQQLRDSTGIKTLKVGFTRMFGYYIEVSKGQSDKMPDSFHRRQTLVNAERYITPELKEYENKVLNAEERIAGIESELFLSLRCEVAKYTQQVINTAQAIAILDTLLSLAECARHYDYIRPVVDDSTSLEIIEGRHPVVEQLGTGEKFIPNDTQLDDDKNRLLLITGPNMAGKSTYIRQVALIAIMAQIGSYVPAKKAHLGIIDCVFTRIGASDDLSKGQSTFMVEMSETANILHNATSRSLVILDEIGRGTSTYDGISIAWSVAEYLLLTEEKMAKTLFATHYWELTKLEEKIPGAVNFHVAVQEAGDHIVFLRKIVRGGTDKSYGIHVGRLAGLPHQVITRAQEILVHLEENANRKSAFEPSKPKRTIQSKSKVTENQYQMTFFE